MDLSIDSSITFLKVADLNRSDRFYRRLLGLELVLDQGGCRIYRLTADSYIGVCERDEPHSTEVIVTIVTDDVDGWHRHLVARGVEPDGSPRENRDYGIYHFFVNDPDGNLVEVQRFADPAWDRGEEVVN